MIYAGCRGALGQGVMSGGKNFRGLATLFSLVGNIFVGGNIVLFLDKRNVENISFLTSL